MEFNSIAEENKMMEIIPDLPENIVAVVASGKITREDYENVQIPVIEEKIRNDTIQ